MRGDFFMDKSSIKNGPQKWLQIVIAMWELQSDLPIF